MDYPEFEEVTEEVEVPKRRFLLSKKIIILAILLGLAGLGVGGLFAIRSYHSPLNVVDEYATSFIDYDTDNIYHMAGYQTSPFISPSRFKTYMMSSVYHNYGKLKSKNIAYYETRLISQTEKELTYNIDFYSKTNVLINTKILIVNQSPGFLHLYSDYQLSPSNFVATDVTIIAPANVQINVGNEILSDSYITKTVTDKSPDDLVLDTYGSFKNQPNPVNSRVDSTSEDARQVTNPITQNYKCDYNYYTIPAIIPDRYDINAMIELYSAYGYYLLRPQSYEETPVWIFYGDYFSSKSEFIESSIASAYSYVTDIQKLVFGDKSIQPYLKSIALNNGHANELLSQSVTDYYKLLKKYNTKSQKRSPAEANKENNYIMNDYCPIVYINKNQTILCFIDSCNFTSPVLNKYSVGYSYIYIDAKTNELLYIHPIYQKMDYY